MKIRIGAGSCGIAAGAGKLYDLMDESLKKGASTDYDLGLTGCIGMCHLEPIVDVYTEEGLFRYVKVTPEDVPGILSQAPEARRLLMGAEDQAAYDMQTRIVTRNYGRINPESLDDYLAVGGYKAAEKVVRTMSPKQVVEEIKVSGLRGRGGAGFPTWFKWNAALTSHDNKKYVVCNADEGDPGAFMDRSVIEGDPHCLIEGMLIAGYTIGADEGIVYVRAEYPLAIKRLEKAIVDATEKGFLGKNIFGVEGLNFTMRIKAGAGAFVCGEETALIASLEGERGMPRFKPPFPAQKGFMAKPTNINNVETYANVPWIIENGGAAFAAMGTEKSKGTKVFAVTGKIKNGGLVEVPMGLTLRDVIFGISGGIEGNKEFKAVQMGGPSGGCIPAPLLDTQIDYEAIQATGAIVGSGGMVVMDETTCMVEMARFFLDFTCNESCGKCTYCRIGTKRMLEILTRIVEGKGVPEDLNTLEQLCYKIKEGSLCGLGQTAPNPVLTTLKYFRNEYEDHILNGKCTAKSCQAFKKYVISADNCVGCTLCAKVCPVNAITGKLKETHVIDRAKCIGCGACEAKCKFKAISEA